MDVRGKKLLVFGDSLTHRGSRTSPDGIDVIEPSSRTSSSPGDLLASYLWEAGAASARVNGRVSRSAVNFWKGNNGEAGARVLVDESVQRRPNLVIVFLGTNDLGMNADADAEAFRLIHETFLANGAEVIAVGPPSFLSSTLNQQAEVVYGSLRKVFGAGRVIDLRPLTSDIVKPSQGRATDGIHFTPQGARLAAARLAHAVVNLGGRPAVVARAGWLPPVAATVVTAVIIGSAWLVRRRRVVDFHERRRRLVST